MLTRSAIGLCGLMLCAAGCASGSTPESSTTDQAGGDASSEVISDSPPTSESQTEEESVGQTVDETADETVNETFVSPVFEALGFDPNDRQEAQNIYVANAEKLVRQCMAQAGFDYVPNIPSFAPSVERQIELNETVSPEQFTAEYGFGISSLVELDFLETGVLAFVELVLGPPPTEARSDGEQAAYELALSGQTIEGLTAEETQEQAFNNLGGLDGSCRSDSYRDADNSVGERFEGLFTLLGDEYAAISEDLQNDPRIRDVNDLWQECMAKFGYRYEDPQEITDELIERSQMVRDKFQSSPETLAIVAAAVQINLAAMDADDRFNFLEQQGAFRGLALVPLLQAELDDLIEFELDIALRDDECGDNETVLAVQLEYEQAFVEAHAEQLNLIASAVP